ncbi:MAG: ABC transporter ATP-binding protein [Erythrobacter sp.]|nr:ABC transporter ATP-binding protein [Erythrobacter sp.]
MSERRSPPDELLITALTSGYGGASVLEGVDLGPCRAGEIVSLLGPNAAGKTTLLRAIAGLQPAHGSVRLAGTELLDLSLADHARLVGYMPQSLPQRIGLTVIEATIGALRTGNWEKGDQGARSLEAIAYDAIEDVGIGHLALREVGHLSGGQRQLASLSQALVRAPRVLLLDEPISALDLHYQLRVMKLVQAVARRRGMIVVMVLHDLSIAARWSDRVALLSGGRIVAQGTPGEAITAERLAEVYRVEATVSPAAQGLSIVIEDIIED